LLCVFVFNSLGACLLRELVWILPHYLYCCSCLLYNHRGIPLPKKNIDPFNANSLVLQHGVEDRFCWKDGNFTCDFSTYAVWNSIRYRLPEVDWVNIVWFSQCIPKHAFLVGLIMRGKLLTQDRLLSWNTSTHRNMNMMCCMLCYSNIDSHSHLFFGCKYSARIWDCVRAKAYMNDVDPI
jgi:hypothetical protein